MDPYFIYRKINLSSVSLTSITIIICGVSAVISSVGFFYQTVSLGERETMIYLCPQYMVEHLIHPNTQKVFIEVIN